LGELFVMLPKESPAFRDAMDALAIAVSLGLQHGVPLETFAETFIGSHPGAGVAVEGDPAVHRAGSVIDYVFRHLAVHYLGRTDLPEPEAEDAAGAAIDPPEGSPCLPLDLPTEAAARQRRRGLRVVGG